MIHAIPLAVKFDTHFDTLWCYNIKQYLFSNLGGWGCAGGKVACIPPSFPAW
jgi:hypothetical protein